ncbi:MAG: DUF4331 domain-containing protein [Synechococcales cyanobacterium C42_A2020_086]|nr:DUF4331 domain-containing protein [Synechococcales cyanobacterium C42_A2020_086]
MAIPQPKQANRVTAALRHWFRPPTPKLKPMLGAIVLATSVAVTALGITSLTQPQPSPASDHDDGDIDVRSRALSLTDLYVFREIDQNPSARADDLIFVMNTNPRSVARIQYFFSNEAQYEFRISRADNNEATPTAVPDLTLRFTFSPPEGSPRRQRMTMTLIERGGRTITVNRTTNNRPIVTTPLATASSPVVNQVNVGGSTVSVFAGLREDPFYFDVEQFFRVRAGLLGRGPAVGFRPPETAVDFATGYNVNAIVVRVPRRLLQGNTNATTFDAWLSLLIKDPRTGRFMQTEQLARPAVNEALVINQSTYALYNRIMPTRASNADVNRIANEAKTVLRALGNNEARVNALLGAFLPDVMRIDTTGPSGFANALNREGSPIRGRLLGDDVVDIAFAVLTNGAVTTDNVSYEGTPGNPAQGHDPLVPAFPYLALPN